MGAGAADFAGSTTELLAEGTGELGLVAETPAERQFTDGQVALRVTQLTMHRLEALLAHPLAECVGRAGEQFVQIAQ
ncbi:hypothetical protein FQZ97_1038250 [compost metagenome]